MLEDSVWWKRHAQCTCDFFNRAKRTYNIKGGFGSNNVITIIIVIIIIITSSSFCCAVGNKIITFDQICVSCRRDMSRGRSDSGGWLRGCLVVFAVVSALGVCGPALYWRFKNAISLRNSHNKFSCPPCLCNCPPPLSLFQLAPGLYLLLLLQIMQIKNLFLINEWMKKIPTNCLLICFFLGMHRIGESLCLRFEFLLYFFIFVWFLFYYLYYGFYDLIGVPLYRLYWQISSFSHLVFAIVF